MVRLEPHWGKRLKLNITNTGQYKEGLLLLENALQDSPKHLKKMLEIDPTLLQHPGVLELVTRYKPVRKRNK